MELGMVGLGRMGANMAQRLVRGGHKVAGFDPDTAARTTSESNAVTSRFMWDSCCSVGNCSPLAHRDYGLASRDRAGFEPFN